MHPYGDCIYCGGEVSEQLTTIDYRFHNQLYVMENVPTGVCQQCGEKFFTAITAKRMEAAVQDLSGSEPRLSVPIVQIA
jgi:YgiT-type zinc finger domain-containing protein